MLNILVPRPKWPWTKLPATTWQTLCSFYWRLPNISIRKTKTYSCQMVGHAVLDKFLQGWCKVSGKAEPSKDWESSPSWNWPALFLDAAGCVFLVPQDSRAGLSCVLTRVDSMKNKIGKEACTVWETDLLSREISIAHKMSPSWEGPPWFFTWEMQNIKASP